MFNTPPVFSVYVSMLNLRWLKKNGGVSWAEAKNLEKSKLLYDCIDSNQLFTGTVKKEDRSVLYILLSILVSKKGSSVKPYE